MPAGKSSAAHLGSTLSPCIEHVKQPVYPALFRPQGQQGAGNLAIEIGGIMVQVDGRSGTVVFASRMNRGGIAKAPQIFGKRLLLHSAGGNLAQHHGFEKELRIVANQCFREWGRLNQEEPMIESRRN